MRGLRQDIQARILRRALYRAAAYLRGQVRQAAPVRTGRMRRAVMAQTTRSVDRTTVVASVGIKPGTPARRYFHLVEKGTRPRRTRTGASKGQMPAQPFILPTAEAQAPAVRAIIAREVQVEIHKAVRQGAYRK